MSRAKSILAALGGAKNIVDLEPCITRIRVEVSKPAKVDLDSLEEQAQGVVRTGAIIQVIVGPDADALVEQIRARM